ncbi:MAG: cardiolipin synthase [Planctomycetes bacterium]|nr:cardiolipin synthase [Planctomycetota bacterium]
MGSPERGGRISARLGPPQATKIAHPAMPDLPLPLLIGVVVLDAYAIARVLLRHHGVSTTVAWILAIAALPVIGAALYFLLAVPHVRHAIRKRRLDAVGAEDYPTNSEGAVELGGQEGASAEIASLFRLTTRLTGMAPTKGNRVPLLTEDERAFERIEEVLAGARETVWAEYYIVKNDVTGRRFLGLLARCAARGVEVRFLYDGVGSLGLDPTLLRAIESAGGRTEVFFPLNPLRRRWSFNLRNHRKLIVVDGEFGFTGGMNIGDQYSGRSRLRGARHFRDTHLEVSGPAVADLARIFCEDWTYATGAQLPFTSPPAPASPGPEGSAVAVLPSGPDQRLNASGMVYFNGVASARERVYLTSPYFIPDEPLVRAMTAAALRGVDVRLLVPARSDVPIVAAAGRSNFLNLVRSGVRVFCYQPSMLHAKSLVVDGSWGLVGSANVDMRSFRLNFEISVVVAERGFARRLEGRFLGALESSEELDGVALAARGTFSRLRDEAARLLSPLL